MTGGIRTRVCCGTKATEHLLKQRAVCQQ